MMEGEEVANGGSEGLKRSVVRPPPTTTPPFHSLGEASSGFRKEQHVGQFRDKEEAIALGTSA